MQINQLVSHLPNTISINGNSKKTEIENFNKENNFGNYLKNAIQEVNQLQLQSDKATNMLAEGKKIDLHEVMIAGQKASISMQAALEIRNKAVEAYQEIMRMQV
ncbi:flagellar hook-basal body complex protein FliE [Siminovitchia acidinfaciens]|uniref:Flagellar hook-basal body complex protein FliE n=1 Tax=Siminovitchia acidinfaciens TaxID=2321395 RepID=A0A429Y2K4_9BACI|nr:flagellar hook-basal body complex protein FliE [Siminovitchia acidinfaciens]RST75481.1 flagellar hook-basal body complex protein FliE [Siminovitchia acidinfaciens]VEF48407.1 flagellar hook-basal body protein FliE [Bacillus freudenreichii]